MAYTIAAEIVGSVHTVAVREGDEVVEGDTIVVLESMKMEIPVLSEWKGRVVEVAVSTGDVVQEGDTLAVIE
jgi:acetyl-CoA carboxylase biotin carboxyl carrier protein